MKSSTLFVTALTLQLLIATTWAVRMESQQANVAAEVRALEKSLAKIEEQSREQSPEMTEAGTGAEDTPEQTEEVAKCFAADGRPACADGDAAVPSQSPGCKEQEPVRSCANLRNGVKDADGTDLFAHKWQKGSTFRSTYLSCVCTHCGGEVRPSAVNKKYQTCRFASEVAGKDGEVAGKEDVVAGTDAEVVGAGTETAGDKTADADANAAGAGVGADAGDKVPAAGDADVAVGDADVAVGDADVAGAGDKAVATEVPGGPRLGLEVVGGRGDKAVIAEMAKQETREVQEHGGAAAEVPGALEVAGDKAKHKTREVQEHGGAAAEVPGALEVAGDKEVAKKEPGAEASNHDTNEYLCGVMTALESLVKTSEPFKPPTKPFCSAVAMQMEMLVARRANRLIQAQKRTDTFLCGVMSELDSSLDIGTTTSTGAEIGFCGKIQQTLPRLLLIHEERQARRRQVSESYMCGLMQGVIGTLKAAKDVGGFPDDVAKLGAAAGLSAERLADGELVLEKGEAHGAGANAAEAAEMLRDKLDSNIEDGRDEDPATLAAQERAIHDLEAEAEMDKNLTEEQRRSGVLLTTHKPSEDASRSDVEREFLANHDSAEDMGHLVQESGERVAGPGMRGLAHPSAGALGGYGARIKALVDEAAGDMDAPKKLALIKAGAGGDDAAVDQLDRLGNKAAPVKNAGGDDAAAESGGGSSEEEAREHGAAEAGGAPEAAHLKDLIAEEESGHGAAAAAATEKLDKLKDATAGDKKALEALKEVDPVDADKVEELVHAKQDGDDTAEESLELIHEAAGDDTAALKKIAGDGAGADEAAAQTATGADEAATQTASGATEEESSAGEAGQAAAVETKADYEKLRALLVAKKDGDDTAATKLEHIKEAAGGDKRALGELSGADGEADEAARIEKLSKAAAAAKALGLIDKSVNGDAEALTELDGSDAELADSLRKLVKAEEDGDEGAGRKLKLIRRAVTGDTAAARELSELDVDGEAVLESALGDGSGEHAGGAEIATGGPHGGESERESESESERVAESDDEKIRRLQEAADNGDQDAAKKLSLIRAAANGDEAAARELADLTRVENDAAASGGADISTSGAGLSAEERADLEKIHLGGGERVLPAEERKAHDIAVTDSEDDECSPKSIWEAEFRDAIPEPKDLELKTSCLDVVLNICTAMKSKGDGEVRNVFSYKGCMAVTCSTHKGKTRMTVSRLMGKSAEECKKYPEWPQCPKGMENNNCRLLQESAATPTTKLMWRSMMCRAYDNTLGQKVAQLHKCSKIKEHLTNGGELAHFNDTDAARGLAGAMDLSEHEGTERVLNEHNGRMIIEVDPIGLRGTL